MGYEQPTEIQQESIPLLCNESTDFIGLAQTGTGKTAAFGLPLLHHVNTHENHIQALILSPTRELSQQIAVQIEDFAKHMDDFYSVTVYGGANISEQIRAIKRGVHVVIATPGRLLDLLNRRAINLDNISTLVLDEADEMLNMGFKEDLDAILSRTPATKKTWLFSATMPKEIRRIVKEYMSPDAVEVAVNKGNQSNQNISHQYISVKTHEKNDALKRYLDSFPDMRGIIFCRTKAGTQSLADGLSREGYGAEAIHGDLSQAQRERVMKRFKSHQLQVLVATDVAARGIDVNDLTHVIHHALPDDSSYYTHRSGRTARAGKTGVSIAFVSGNDQRKLKMLQKQFDQEFEKQEVPSLASVLERRAMNWVESVKETKVSEKLPMEIIAAVIDALEHETKETMISKMLSNSLGSLMEEKEKAFNQSGERGERGRRDRDRDRGPRDRREREPRDRRDREPRERTRDREKPPTTKEGFHRYFINVGAQDDLTKGTLIDFITETSHVPRKALGDVRMLQKNSFFEIDEKHSPGFADQFSQIYVGDRALRVNRDDDGSQDSGSRGGGRDKKPFERRSRDSRDGGSRDRRGPSGNRDRDRGGRDSNPRRRR